MCNRQRSCSGRWLAWRACYRGWGMHARACILQVVPALGVCSNRCLPRRGVLCIMNVGCYNYDLASQMCAGAARGGARWLARKASRSRGEGVSSIPRPGVFCTMLC